MARPNDRLRKSGNVKKDALPAAGARQTGRPTLLNRVAFTPGQFITCARLPRPWKRQYARGHGT